MKKLFISALSMLAVAMGFTACTSDDDVTSTPDTPKLITVYATTEQPSATRTSLNVDEGSETDGYEVLWSEGDQIRIVSATTYADFTLKTESANKSTGKFEGSLTFNDNEVYSAYYPTTYYDNENRKTIWPASQTYVANNIPLGVPMKATFTYSGEEPSISFKNEGGILRLNLKGEANVTSITISATDLDAITLSCGTVVPLNTTTATPFYIAVPGADDPGTAYSGLKIVITDDAGKTCTKTANVSVTVQRSMITDINLTASSFKAPARGKTYAADPGCDVNWVQLWEGGPKFAEYNVGATSVTEYGGYYTWISDITHPFYTDNEYCYYGPYWTVGNNLEGIDDNAIKLWGTNWRTPTIEELTALFNNCDSEWTDSYNDSGIKGRIYTGKGDYSSNSVFLPAAGYFSDNTTYSDTADPDDLGVTGCYWSSTSGASLPGGGCHLVCFSSGYSGATYYAPATRQSVRAVLAE